MENIRIELIRIFNRHKYPIELALLESIAELFYMHQGSLEEEVTALRTHLDERRQEVAYLQLTNAELFNELLETSAKYTEAIILAMGQHEAEMRFKDKEVREKEIVGDKL